MKKILILANNDVGLYKFRKDLIQELIQQGNHIYISLPGGEMVQKMINMGCTFIDTDLDRRGINPIKDYYLFKKYLKILKNVNPDIVMSYTVKPNVYGGIACLITKVTYAINITGLGTAFQQDGLLKTIIVFLYKISCKNAKVVFFENEENRRMFIDNKIVKEAKTYKLNGAGVNLEEYNLHAYPVETEGIRFLFIGRVMKEKGVEELFEVAKQIKLEYKNIVFDIVGPIEDHYEEEIKKLSTKGIIKYHGFQEDVKPFIKQAHCFVLPSYHEGMANTLLECGAMGRPLITSNIYGCKEAVIDRENGYLVEIKSREDLFTKVKNFIELSHEKKSKMGAASRIHIENIFNKDKVVAMTIKKLSE